METQTQTPNLSTLIDADRVLLPLVNPIVQAVTGWPRSLMQEFQSRMDSAWSESQITMVSEPFHGFKITVVTLADQPGYAWLQIGVVQPENEIAPNQVD